MNGFGDRPVNLPGLGGPGSGITQMPAVKPDPMGGLLEWLSFQGAGGFGLGPYGYPLLYGGALDGQQNLMLNQQWGWGGIGTPEHHPFLR